MIPISYLLVFSSAIIKYSFVMWDWLTQCYDYYQQIGFGCVVNIVASAIGATYYV